MIYLSGRNNFAKIEFSVFVVETILKPQQLNGAQDEIFN